MFSLFKKIFASFSVAEHRVFWGSFAAAILSLLVLGGSALNKSTKVVPAKGGDYTEGMIGQPIYINPVLASTEVDKSLVRLLFGNLSQLADKITMSDNGRVWDVRLKENLHWSDGQKLTSDDVIFTIQKIQDPTTDSPLFLDWQGVVANRVSELEIQFNLTVPYAFFDNNLKELYIIPKHLFAETPAPNWQLSQYNLQPIGSGPYEYDSYQTQNDGFIVSYNLKPNPDYFGDKPLIQNFRFDFYPNKTSLVNAFNDGGVDGAASLDASDLANIKRSYQTIAFPLPNYYAIFFNQSQNLPLQDAKVRQALSLAIDRDELVRDVFQNNAAPATGPVLPNALPLSSENSSGTAADGLTNSQQAATTTPSFSPDLANQILDQDGWKIASSGIHQKKIKSSVIDLEIGLTVPQIDFLVQTANKIKDDWQKIGVTTNINVLPPEEIDSNVIKNRNYQGIIYGYLLNPSSDLFSFWHSSERFYPGLNLSLYENKKADSLIEAIRQTTDAGQRTQQFAQLQKIITDDYPAVFLYSHPYLYITTKDLQGIDSGLIAQPADRLDNANRWFIKTARVLK